jgi:hypothetical protein
MENPHPARGGTLASKRQTLNKKQFIQYEPHLVEELNDKKTKNQSVSGRLLTLLYKRLSFWSRYAKHQYQGRRYFWKSIPELSEELQYSEKQVARGLKALAELGMIVREKLNKHNWKHTYYYYLPHSVHTAEPEPTPNHTTTTSSIRSTSSSFGAGSGQSVAGDHLNPVPTASGARPEPVAGDHLNPVPTASGARPAGRTTTSTSTSTKGTAGAPDGTGGADLPATHTSKVSSPPAGAVQPKGQHRTRHFESTIINRRTPLLENQLRTIVEKCLDYSINPPKPITRRGVGFAT